MFTFLKYTIKKVKRTTNSVADNIIIKKLNNKPKILFKKIEWNKKFMFIAIIIVSIDKITKKLLLIAKIKLKNPIKKTILDIIKTKVKEKIIIY